MKLKTLSAFLLAAAISASAQNFQDGIDYYKADQFDNAKELLERNLNASGTDKALSYYYLGQIAMSPYANEKPNKGLARTYFDKGVAANPECAYNYVGMGALDLLNGQDKAAEANFKLASKYAKKDHEVLVEIARAYYNADPVKYAKEIEKYTTKAWKDSKYKEPSYYIFEGDVALDQADNNKAAEQFEQAMRVAENSPAAFVKYAQAYFRTTNDGNKKYAIKQLEDFLARNPNSALVQRELAEKYYDNRQWLKAAEQYGKYIQNPNHFPQDKNRYAFLLYYSKDYPKTIEVCDELLAANPKDENAVRLKMLSYNKLENYPACVEAGEVLFAIPEEKLASDYTVYANALTQTGNEAKAVEALKDGIQKFKGTENVDDIQQALYSVAVRKMSEAREHESLDERAVIAQEGVDIMKVLLEANPNSASYIYRLAELTMMANKNELNAEVTQAFENVVKALEDMGAEKTPESDNAPIYKRAYSIIAISYVKSNNKDKAAEAYENLLLVDPENAGAKKFLNK